MQKHISIVWFRQDLRTCDNPALAAAAEQGHILPIYIHDNITSAPFKMGAVSKIGLHHALNQLNKDLQGNLNIYHGPASEILSQLVLKYPVKNIFLNKSPEPWHTSQEHDAARICKQHAIKCTVFNGNYLWWPHDVLKPDGSFYKVFTAYKNKALLQPIRPYINNTAPLHCISDPESIKNVDVLQLRPTLSWGKNIEAAWDMGQHVAQQKLDFFIKNSLNGYQEARDYPAINSTSSLSCYLHFGNISPVHIFNALRTKNTSADKDHFISELVWREFSAYLLHYFPTLYKDNFNPKFDKFGWDVHAPFLKAWQQGKTGYPLVDAGMRQLWQTGYMHNRVRMVVASFLVKNLNIHWHYGRDWFWDCLLDADLANNSASWQWVAGCGVDAAPYFRVFNPITQGEKFDKEGEYIRKYVPEISQLPNKYLFQPWTAPAYVLQSAGVFLGKNYPRPIIDVAQSRQEALQRYHAL